MATMAEEEGAPGGAAPSAARPGPTTAQGGGGPTPEQVGKNQVINRIAKNNAYWSLQMPVYFCLLISSPHSVVPVCSGGMLRNKKLPSTCLWINTIPTYMSF